MAVVPSHSLTVVQLQFSHNDKYLLSVSRDRHFSLFQVNESDKSDKSDSSSPSVEVTLLCRVQAHERIIWSCSWNFNDNYFITGSRDKSVIIINVYV